MGTVNGQARIYLGGLKYIRNFTVCFLAIVPDLPFVRNESIPVLKFMIDLVVEKRLGSSVFNQNDRLGALLTVLLQYKR